MTGLTPKKVKRKSNYTMIYQNVLFLGQNKDHSSKTIVKKVVTLISGIQNYFGGEISGQSKQIQCKLANMNA